MDVRKVITTKRFNGFRTISEDGVPSPLQRQRSNGFKMVVNDENEKLKPKLASVQHQSNNTKHSYTATPII